VPLLRSSREPNESEALIFDSTPAANWPSILGSQALVDVDRAGRVWQTFLELFDEYPSLFAPLP